MPVLDTNFLIMLSREDNTTIRALRRIADKELVVPAQAVAEYLAGFEDTKEELIGVHESFKVAHTSDPHLMAMADIAQHARARAVRPRWGDIHIAAQARLRDTYVVTTNRRHFRQLGVVAWDWRKDRDPPPLE